MWKKNKYNGVIIIEGHVQGLANVRALGMLSIPVIVIDKNNCIARYSKYCLNYYKCPDYNTYEFIEFLVKLSIENNLKNWMLLPSNDHAVYNLSKNKQKLKKYYKIVSPDLEIIENIINKKNLLNLAKQIGIPIPCSSYLSKGDYNIDKLKYPIIIKGNKGLSFFKKFNTKVFMAKNKLEYEKYLTIIKKRYSIDEIFIQELIPFKNNNKTISYTAFSIDGIIKTYWMGAKLREHPFEFGTATYCESVCIKELHNLSSILIKELKYTGVCEIEFLFDPRDKEYKLIEVNARTWLWVGLAIASGINYPLMVYNFVNGIETEYPTTYIIGLKWRNLWTDLFYSITAVIKRKLNFKELLTSLRGKTIYGVFSFNDIKPFVAFSVMLIYLFKKR